MKTFETLTRKCQSETNFYKVQIKNALGEDKKEIFVSTPLVTMEFKSFIARRIAEHLQDRVTVVECYTKLTPIEREEVYGLDSFARILSAINANAQRIWNITYRDTEGNINSMRANTDTTTSFMDGGMKFGDILLIRPDGWGIPLCPR